MKCPACKNDLPGHLEIPAAIVNNLTQSGEPIKCLIRIKIKEVYQCECGFRVEIPEVYLLSPLVNKIIKEQKNDKEKATG